MTESVPIVAIGASAGGLEAISELLGELRTDLGFAYIIVQHLDASHSSMLAEILGKKTAMPVAEATQHAAIESNRVYVITPNTSMTVAQDRLVLEPRRTLGRPMPVDDLMESLAQKGEDVIAVILSGSGSDGARGMRAIKDHGGITFAQDSGSARFNSMPQAAIALGCVDFVLPPKQIATHIGRLGRHPYLAKARAKVSDTAVGVDEKNLRYVFRRLRNVCGIDFAQYKRGTISRRLARRLALHDVSILDEYLTLLENDSAEVRALCQDLLISVSSFFRDPATFDALKATVLPHLLDRRPAQMPLRIWVPGCATGEEVYSIAICLAEYLGERLAQTPIQIFGTDVSEAAIETARTGLYIESIARDVSEERLRRFFVKQDACYHIAKSLRNLCIFSRQDVTHDPPFSRIDLVSCRNLLIYFGPELQKRVMATVHYGLNPNGLLMLGASETIGPFSDLFRPFGGEGSKIFQKKSVPGRAVLELRAAAPEHRTPGEVADADEPVADDVAQLEEAADRIALARYAPASVLCDDELNVLQFRGDTSAFLAHASGTPSLNLKKMARADLLVPLGNAVQQARHTGAPARAQGIRMESEAGVRRVDLEVVPVSSGAPSFLIFFEATQSLRGAPHGLPGRTFWQRLWRRGDGESIDGEAEPSRLAGELEASRAYIHTLVERHDSTVEELKSAQEELLSSNEEFQSTNEELQTAKEELESTNEELVTTNDELLQRNRDLARFNEDLRQARDYADAIVETLRAPLLVLDADLRVIRANRGFYAMFDTNREVTEGGHLYALGEQQWDDPELCRRLQRTLSDTGDLEDFEMKRVFPNLGEKTMRLSARGLSWSNHALILLVIEDVTEYKAALRTLEISTQRAHEFLAMLAHELRNPLAAIRSAWEIWQRGDAGADLEQQAQAMLDRQLRKETRLIDDLLDISRITRGIITLHTRPVDLVPAVNEAVEEMRTLVNAYRHTLTLALPSQPVVVEGDATRLEQVAANLLGNSIKFTEPGGRIDLSLACSGEEAVLEVADNGIGIAPELLPQIFELFVQGQRSADRSQGGLGLGLTLVRRLVELHGGTIEAKSAGVNRGSTFTVRLPLASIPEASRTMAEPEPEAQDGEAVSRRMLVVDDNVDTLAAMAILLRLDKHTVETASDGPAALAIARTFAPEIVLLDIGLPGLDGYEVARRLRGMAETETALLIAVSGYGGAEVVQQSHEAGFDHHLVKPVDMKELTALLATYRAG